MKHGRLHYMYLATLKIFLKQLPGLAPPASTCIISDKQSDITWSTYWREILIAELSWIYQLQMMNNRVFNNSVRIVKDVHFPWMNELPNLKTISSSCPTRNWHWLSVTCRVKTYFSRHPNLDVTKAYMRGCNFTWTVLFLIRKKG